MYAFIWRLLPGPTPAKVAQAIVLLLLVFWLLMAVVFPAVEPHLPIDDVVIGSAPTGAQDSASGADMRF